MNEKAMLQHQNIKRACAKKTLAVAFCAGGVCALALAQPGLAEAASITNSLSVSANTVKVGKSLTFKAKTSFIQQEVGGFSIPFTSDWQTELSSLYFGKPTTLAKTGEVGAWKKETGKIIGGSQWVQKSKVKFFTTNQTWYCKAKATAKKKAKRVVFAHGQVSGYSWAPDAQQYVKVTK